MISKEQQLYENLTCHPSQIVDVDIHPSGRMMVTVALDKKIKLWNLMNMKEVYHKNLMKNVDFVRFAPDNNLLLCMMENIAVFDTKTNSIGAVIEHDARITDIAVKDNYIVSSDDGGKIYIRLYEPGQDKSFSTIKFQAFDKRVKQLNFHRENGSSILVAISTEGYIAIYDIEELLDSLASLKGKIMDLEGEFDSIYRFDIDSRLIALGSRLNFLKVEPGDKAESLSS